MTSFNALLAPFLIDSYELETKVLDSPIAGDALGGLDSLGRGWDRYPTGPVEAAVRVCACVLRPEDFAGATVAIGPEDLTADTLKALGATTKVIAVGGARWRRRGGGAVAGDHRQPLPERDAIHRRECGLVAPAGGLLREPIDLPLSLRTNNRRHSVLRCSRLPQRRSATCTRSRMRPSRRCVPTAPIWPSRQARISRPFGPPSNPSTTRSTRTPRPPPRSPRSRR